MYSFIFIDDENLMREFFEEVVSFEDYGFELKAMFSSAEGALEWLNDHPETNAVITDIRMGGVSGLDFCEKVRKHNKNILLVIMSGYQEFEYARRALRCNVFDYLLKPVMYEDIDMLFKRMRHQMDAGNQSEVQKEEADYQYESMINKIKGYIEDNYAQDITLDLVAKHVALNPSYLSRFFKQHTGSNFLDYVSTVRIQKAIEYLADPSIKIADVGVLVGYRTIPHFLKLFKQYTGCTPSEYRTNKYSSVRQMNQEKSDC
ncbi:MAG: helix-turn-helix domain-containing protein [Lachnospiraceae bacterium]|nr:helix-turn-helix domain-containing protein [Lachnospiraceae bacterium]